MSSEPGGGGGEGEGRGGGGEGRRERRGRRGGGGLYNVIRGILSSNDHYSSDCKRKSFE